MTMYMKRFTMYQNIKRNVLSLINITVTVPSVAGCTFAGVVEQDLP